MTSGYVIWVSLLTVTYTAIGVAVWLWAYRRDQEFIDRTVKDAAGPTASGLATSLLMCFSVLTWPVLLAGLLFEEVRDRLALRAHMRTHKNEKSTSDDARRG